MTTKERTELLDKVSELCGEQCHGYCFVALVDTNDEGEKPGATATITMYEGGIDLAVGLSERLRARLKAKVRECEKDQ